MSSDEHEHPALFAGQQQMLHERLLYFLGALHPALREDVERALEEKGKLLSPVVDRLPAGHWGLITFLVAAHIAPDINPLVISSVAVAVECFICALDLLDDIEDEDQTPIVALLGPARVLNVSTALLTLAQRAILSVSQLGVDPSLILRLLDTLQDATLTATGGQHRDLLAEQQSALAISPEECLAVATEKAGALMRLACSLGAICAGADEETRVLVAELGELLGVAQQLDNDSHDLYYLIQGKSAIEPAPGSIKTDLVRGKKTLPIILAARSRHTLQKAPSLADEENQEAHLRSLHEGIIATWGIGLLYRERARDCLQNIEARRPVAPALRLLLGFV